MAEYFVERGRDVLIVYDDLTCHARSYRELSLLLRRPPGREAFPGDIFYIHSRMLERSTHLKEERGGGSLTSLPITETEAQDLSSYIPTNLISITDGQIYLSPRLFQKGHPACRGCGKIRVPRGEARPNCPLIALWQAIYACLTPNSRNLNRFPGFGTRLDESTRRVLERGWRSREILKQPQYQPMPASEQIASLIAITGGALDHIPVEGIRDAELKVREAIKEQSADACLRIEKGEKMTTDDLDAMLAVAENAVGAPKLPERK